MRFPYEPTDRRALFRSTFGQWMEKAMERAEERVVTKRYQRPPGALPEVGFLAACTRCGLCAEPCPPKAIRLATERGWACRGHALHRLEYPAVHGLPRHAVRQSLPDRRPHLPSAGWTGYRLATLELISERCVTFKGQSCRVCADSCPVGESALTMDEDGHPVIKVEGCVGCGVCVRACITSPSSYQLTPLEA